MRLNLIDFHSDSRARVNEDCVGATDSAAWVLDGATGLGQSYLPGNSDAVWFVTSLDEAFRKEFTSSAKSPTGQALKLALQRITEAFKKSSNGEPIVPYEAPSASFAMVRLVEKNLELHTLGDCKIIYQIDTGPITVFGKSKVEELDEGARKELMGVKDGTPGISHGDALLRIRSTLRANRSRMNTPDGYWVLGLDDSAVDHLQSQIIDLSNIYKIAVLLMSDGFTRIYDTFKKYDLESVLFKALKGDGRKMIEEIRRLESADPACSSFVRFKAHDDATFLVASINSR